MELQPISPCRSILAYTATHFSNLTWVVPILLMVCANSYIVTLHCCLVSSACHPSPGWIQSFFVNRTCLPAQSFTPTCSSVVSVSHMLSQWVTHCSISSSRFQLLTQFISCTTFFKWKYLFLHFNLDKFYPNISIIQRGVAHIAIVIILSAPSA